MNERTFQTRQSKFSAPRPVARRPEQVLGTLNENVNDPAVGQVVATMIASRDCSLKGVIFVKAEKPAVLKLTSTTTNMANSVLFPVQPELNQIDESIAILKGAVVELSIESMESPISTIYIGAEICGQ